MKREQIDQFLQLEEKDLEIGTPANMADLSGDGMCDHLYRAEVLKEKRGLRVWLQSSYTAAGLPDFKITLGDTRPFWTVIYSPTVIYRKLVGRDDGPPRLGRIEGPRYYSWLDNRAYFPDGPQPFVPQIARPLPAHLLNYKYVVRWLCRQANINPPEPNLIFRPRGLP